MPKKNNVKGPPEQLSKCTGDTSTGEGVPPWLQNTSVTDAHCTMATNHNEESKVKKMKPRALDEAR